ncbi:hypothetical protein BCO26_2755 [Heyndrickxia coagulans 2-6]|nr:hypothetical protein BCO26_2755 [Heyndrickxia coagulans 2-6]
MEACFCKEKRLLPLKKSQFSGLVAGVLLGGMTFYEKKRILLL